MKKIISNSSTEGSALLIALALFTSIGVVGLLVMERLKFSTDGKKRLGIHYSLLQTEGKVRSILAARESYLISPYPSPAPSATEAPAANAVIVAAKPNIFEAIKRNLDGSPCSTQCEIQVTQFNFSPPQYPVMPIPRPSPTPEPTGATAVLEIQYKPRNMPGAAPNRRQVQVNIPPSFFEGASTSSGTCTTAAPLMVGYYEDGSPICNALPSCPVGQYFTLYQGSSRCVDVVVPPCASGGVLGSQIVTEVKFTQQTGPTPAGFSVTCSASPLPFIYPSPGVTP